MNLALVVILCHDCLKFKLITEVRVEKSIILLIFAF